MVTYSTHLALMSSLLFLMCNDTPVHPIDTLNHEQARSNSINLMREVTGQLQPAPNFQHAYYDLDRYCVSSIFAQAVLIRTLFHVVLNVHLWCKPCASQKLTTPVFQLPTFAPLNFKSDSKWYANINAFSFGS
jgi:hypothetical protein